MATFGKGVEYALHCMLYLIDAPAGANITVGDLANFQGVSRTYLAKIFTKLNKAGLVRSAIGVKGGYELAKPADKISFWDVVVALEGKVNLFECREVRKDCVLYRDAEEKPKWLVSGVCEIHRVMMDAEEAVQEALKKKTLAWLAEEVGHKIPKEAAKKVSQWFLDLQSKKE